MTADLISRLEALTGPSREVDSDIAILIGAVPEGMERCGPGWWGGGGEQWEVPRYTESLDAAVKLLGERPCVLKIKNANGKAEARVGALPGEDYMIKRGEHSVPSIALLIAILRARESA